MMAALPLCADVVTVVDVEKGHHTLSFYKEFKKYEEDSLGSSKSLLFGASYSYLKSAGYNFKGRLALLDFSKTRENSEIELVNSYNFLFSPETTIFPIVSLNAYSHGFEPTTSNGKEIKRTRVENTNLGLGLGVEKRFAASVSLGAEFSVLRDLAKHYVVKNLHRTTHTNDMKKEVGYQIHFPIGFYFNENMSVTISPMYAAAFGEGFKEQKIRGSFSYSF